MDKIEHTGQNKGRKRFEYHFIKRRLRPVRNKQCRENHLYEANMSSSESCLRQDFHDELPHMTSLHGFVT